MQINNILLMKFNFEYYIAIVIAFILDIYDYLLILFSNVKNRIFSSSNNNNIYKELVNTNNVTKPSKINLKNANINNLYTIINKL